MSEIPEGVKQIKDWRAIEYAGPMRCLVLSDIHVPFHDKEALELAIGRGREQKADFVLLNGDVMDCFALSDFNKNLKDRDLANELKTGRKVLQQIRKAFPKARMVFKEGNHEERWDRYLRYHADMLLGLEEFSWQHNFGLGELGIEFVGEKRTVRLGKLNVIHGHEYRFMISNPVNPARGIYLRAKTHCLAGHFHQRSQHTATTLEGHVVSTWSVGALCDLHPEYRPYNEWSHGFAFVAVDKAGSFTVENHLIRNGAIW